MKARAPNRLPRYGHKRGLLATGLALTMSLGSTAHAADWVSLFDGKTLQGWSVDPAHAKNFSVKNGVILADGASGWLKSDRTYSNFRLRFQFRFVSPDGSGNGGVFMRTPANTNFARGWPGNSFELEVRDMTTSRTLAPPWMGQFLRLGSAPEGGASFDSDLAARAYKKTGEWQQGEIAADGDRLTGFINGKQVSSAEGVTNLEGYIGLQAEVGALEYRAVEIQELTPGALAVPQPLFDGKSLAGWQVIAPATAETFRPADGGLQVGGNGGWLKSDRTYSDFKLNFEFRLVTDDAESAVVIRAPDARAEALTDGVEINIRRNSNARPTTAVGDPRWLGAIVRRGKSQGPSFMDSKAILRVHKTDGSWQAAEIEVVGDTVRVKIDGIEVSRADKIGARAGGFIGIKSVKGRVDIRSAVISRASGTAGIGR